MNHLKLATIHDDAMAENRPSAEEELQFPVRCPRCGLLTTMTSPALVVDTALNRWNNMRLHADCHAVSWDANPQELRSIRAYLNGPRDPGAAAPQDRNRS